MERDVLVITNDRGPYAAWYTDEPIPEYVNFLKNESAAAPLLLTLSGHPDLVLSIPPGGNFALELRKTIPLLLRMFHEKNRSNFYAALSNPGAYVLHNGEWEWHYECLCGRSLYSGTKPVDPANDESIARWIDPERGA